MQIETKIPCTEEEKRIYGVEFKTEGNKYKPSIVEQKFADDGEYYTVHSGTWNCYSNHIYKSLDKAKEFLIEQHKDK